jgi:TRAP-type C4-dicarboxylate transport system permease small subunit
MFLILSGVMIQVFFRYILNQPLMFLSEFTAWSLVWAGYLGAGVALKTQEHISLNLFIDCTNPRYHLLLKILSKCILLIFIISLCYFGFIQALTNTAFSWAIGVKVMWGNLGIPIAGILMLSHIIYHIMEDITSALKPEI